MTDPTTRPSELSDIVSDDNKFRWYVVMKLERLDGKADKIDERLHNHMNDDTTRFGEVRADIKDLKGSIGNVTSNVTGLEKDKSFVMGARGMATWMIGTAIAIIAIAVTIIIAVLK